MADPVATRRSGPPRPRLPEQPAALDAQEAACVLLKERWQTVHADNAWIAVDRADEFVCSRSPHGLVSCKAQET